MEYSGDTAVWDLGVGSYYVECEVMVEGLELLHFHLVAIMTQEEYDEALRALDEPESALEEKMDVSVPGVVDLPPVFEEPNKRNSHACWKSIHAVIKRK